MSHSFIMENIWMEIRGDSVNSRQRGTRRLLDFYNILFDCLYPVLAGFRIQCMRNCDNEPLVWRLKIFE